MRLNEQMLTDSLSVSRVPVREALPLLAQDGFIMQAPRRSAVVTTWTARSVNELFDVRLSLEVAAARYACREVAKGTSLAMLEELVQQSEEILSSGKDLEVAEASASFHESLVELTHNQLLISLSRQISQRMTWLFYITRLRDPHTACREHWQLLQAVATGNEELAGALAYTHIELGRGPSLEAIEPRRAQEGDSEIVRLTTKKRTQGRGESTQIQ
jgi:DNA-binding GntR family transcriptional regulator